MAGKAGPIATVGIIGAGAAALIFGLSSPDTFDPGGEPVEEQPGQEEIPIYERDVVQRVYKPVSGKQIRLVGVQRNESDVVEDTDHGRAVVASVVPEDALCNLLIDAPEVDHQYGDPQFAPPKKVPNVPSLIPHYGKVSWPVRIEGSQQGNKWVWNVILQGQGCIAAASAGASVVGSSSEELAKLPPGLKNRFLRLRGQSNDIEFVPHGWAGRDDLNYVPIKASVVQSRYNRCLLEEYKDNPPCR